jgi:hypothetical protein
VQVIRTSRCSVADREHPVQSPSGAEGAPPLLHVRQDLPWRTALVIVQLDLPD